MCYFQCISKWVTHIGLSFNTLSYSITFLIFYYKVLFFTHRSFTYSVLVFQYFLIGHANKYSTINKIWNIFYTIIYLIDRLHSLLNDYLMRKRDRMDEWGCEWGQEIMLTRAVTRTVRVKTLISVIPWQARLSRAISDKSYFFFTFT